MVVPLVGTWIEIQNVLDILEVLRVVPLVGTWIEIHYPRHPKVHRQVVPLVGTWIEIFGKTPGNGSLKSFPSWERGLKLLGRRLGVKMDTRRSPRGNVD